MYKRLSLKPLKIKQSKFKCISVTEMILSCSSNLAIYISLYQKFIGIQKQSLFMYMAAVIFMMQRDLAMNNILKNISDRNILGTD